MFPFQPSPIKLSSPAEATIECYFETLGALLGKTYEDLIESQIFQTYGRCTPDITLPEIALLYKHYGYSGDYQLVSTRGQLMDHLLKVFSERQRQTALDKQKYLRMKLAAGFVNNPVIPLYFTCARDDLVKHKGRMVELQFWFKDGQIKHAAVDHDYVEGKLVSREVQLPPDNQV